MRFSACWVSSAAFLIGGTCYGQGFVNLNFESANVSGYSVGSAIPASKAFPGWTVSANYVYYDNISLSGDSVSIIDANDPASYPPLQGKYFALLVAATSTYPNYGPISISQTGEIPASAESITFWGEDTGLQVTFAGQPLTFSAIGTTPNYTIYEADISAFAGQTGQLLFTAAPFSGGGQIDNIQFSSSPVPEPGALALAGIGAALAGVGFRRKSFK